MDANEIKQQFKKRKIRQILLAIPFTPVAFILVFTSRSDDQLIASIPNEHLLLGSLVLVVLGLIFSLINWRCPNCNKYLGKNANLKFCPKCGVELR